MKTKTFLIIGIVLIGSICKAQNIEQEVLERYNNQQYDHLYKYLANTVIYPREAMDVQGVLLPGIVLDSSGEIMQVFCLNSVHPAVDEHVLKVLKNTDGSWKPLDEISEPIVFIISFVFTRGNLDYTIHKEHFSLPIMGPITVKLYGADDSKEVRANRLLSTYDRYSRRGEYDLAKEVIVTLLKREPLNIDYLQKLTEVELRLGNNESSQQVKNFIKKYFRELPESMQENP